ncbi:MAG: alpha/beta hydrolase [Pseudomonadota bacterium]
MIYDTFPLTIDGVDVRLAYHRRDGALPPLVSLHGFGSTKEDYADLAQRPDFAGRGLIAWDAPGCGASTVSDPEALSIPFLVKVAQAALEALGVQQFHLSGHSMGGLTALLLAQAQPDHVLSFGNIEGNIAPEDCFLSRQIISHPAGTPEAFMTGFIERVRTRPEFASALYAAALPIKVQAASFKPIFTSMVEISDSEPLTEIFGRLTMPRAFVHGAQNSHLSYLPKLPELGVKVVEISDAGHFPMYSNPPALWQAMAALIAQAEAPQ